MFLEATIFMHSMSVVFYYCGVCPTCYPLPCKSQEAEGRPPAKHLGSGCRCTESSSATAAMRLKIVPGRSPRKAITLAPP